MSFYRDRIVPYLVAVSMRQPDLAVYRHRLVSAAEGVVLEVGIGSGLNLPHYTQRAARIIGLEPSVKLLSMTRRAAKDTPLPVELMEGSAEAIPLEDKSVETVLTTWTLCTIPDVSRALSEMRRVLKPNGRLLFVEHGLAPDANVRRWQNRLNPLWKRLAGGCNLNRPIRQLIEEAGFRIEHMDAAYMKGPKVMTFMYEGSARSQ